MSTKKKIIIVIVLVLFLASAYGINYYRELVSYRQGIEDLHIEDIDLSKIADGIYRGSHEIIWVGAEVEVYIDNNEMVDIKLLEHKNDQGESAEIIIERVISKQSLDIDVISGATASSKIILKAIEKALH